MLPGFLSLMRRLGWSVILTVTLPATPYAMRCYRQPDWVTLAQYLAPRIRSGLGRLVSPYLVMW